MPSHSFFRLMKRPRLWAAGMLSASLLFVPVCSVSASAPGAANGASGAQIALYPIVKQKKHHTVSELTAEDFSVSDDGTSVDSRELQVSADGQNDPHRITLLFDQLTPVHTRAAVQTAARLLKHIPDGTGEMAVWSVEDALYIDQPHTRDRALVLAAMHGLDDRSQPALDLTPVSIDAEPVQTVDGESQQVLEQARSLAMSRHLPWAVSALAALAVSERSLPGRKAVVYFTDQMPTGLYAEDVFRSLAQDLDAAGVSLFVIDMNALDAQANDRAQVAMMMGSLSTQMHVDVGSTSTLITPSPNRLMGQAQQSEMTNTISQIELQGTRKDSNFLEQAAVRSGGRYSHAEDSIGKTARELVHDLTDYCTLRYSLPGAAAPGNFHPVAVTVPGGVWHGGYFPVPAGAETQPPSLQIRPLQLVSAAVFQTLTAGSTGSGLALDAALLRMGGEADKVQGVLAVEVPVRELDLEEDGTTKLFSLHASIAAEITDASGKTVARFEQEFQRHGAIDAEPAFRAEYLSLLRPLSAPFGTYSVHVLVRDWNSGRIGSSVSTVSPAAESGGPLLSDLVLVRTTQQAGGASAALPYGDREVVPNVSGVAGAGSGLNSGNVSLYFEEHASSLEPQALANQPQALSLEVFRGGRTVATLPLAVKPNVDGSSAQMARVSLGDASGMYTFVLCLKTADGTVRRSLSVLVQPSSPGPSAASKASDAEAHTAAAAAIAGGVHSVEVGLAPVETGALDRTSQDALLADARQHALSYNDLLPNFLCLETIERSKKSKGDGDWEHVDTITERLLYRQKSEERSVVMLNGEKTHMSADSIEGAHSNGEFGGILQAIFDPAVHAQFQWQKSAQDDGETVQVFRFKVALKDSNYFVNSPGDSQIRTAFNGYIYIDNDTHAVRRLLASTEELPAGFPIKATWIALRYDYVAINNHEYLMPASGEVGLVHGRHGMDLNELRFSNYRRFGSRVRMLGTAESASR
jgi:VWFA-related protein